MIQKTKDNIEQLVNDIHNHDVNLYDREVYIHGYYKGDSEDSGLIDWRVSTTFIKNLRLLDVISNDPILIHLQSEGGDWGSGMAMYNAIEHTKSYVIMLAYGETCSMAPIIFQSADFRVLMPDSLIMIHYGSIGMDEMSSVAVKSMVDVNEAASKKMLQIFAEKAIKSKFFKGKSHKQVESYIDKKLKEKHDWYMTAEEAVEMGFADTILGSGSYHHIDDLKKGV